MATYDALLLAFDMDNRVDEAETLWNMILHTSTRSVSKRLFSRMISLYDHHHVPDKIVEVNEIFCRIPNWSKNNWLYSSLSAEQHDAVDYPHFYLS